MQLELNDLKAKVLRLTEQSTQHAAQLGILPTVSESLKGLSLQKIRSWDGDTVYQTWPIMTANNLLSLRLKCSNSWINSRSLPSSITKEPCLFFVGFIFQSSPFMVLRYHLVIFWSIVSSFDNCFISFSTFILLLPFIFIIILLFSFFFFFFFFFFCCSSLLRQTPPPPSRDSNINDSLMWILPCTCPYEEDTAPITGGPPLYLATESAYLHDKWQNNSGWLVRIEVFKNHCF